MTADLFLWIVIAFLTIWIGLLSLFLALIWSEERRFFDAQNLLHQQQEMQGDFLNDVDHRLSDVETRETKP